MQAALNRRDDTGQKALTDHRRRATGIVSAVIFITAVLVLSFVVQGTHESTHRFFVFGQVTREGGGPACGVVILAGAERGTTDSAGQYRILLHLHHPDSGEANDVGVVVDVRVAGTSISTQTTAMPSLSAEGWGESRVDFVVPPEVGQECANPLLLATLYVGVPVAIVAVGIVTYVKVVRPWSASRVSAPGLSRLPGVGKSRLRELESMGIRTLEDMSKADPTEVAERTSISRREAKRLSKRARTILEGPSER